jgi:hypothetical protein
MTEAQSEQPESRSFEMVSGELQRRLDDASGALERLRVQQAAYNSLLSQIQGDLNAALALSREVKGLAEQKGEEPPGVVATLQAAVEKTRETVAGQVEHVRERAVAAFHRIKGDNPSEDSGRARLDDRS